MKQYLDLVQTILKEGTLKPNRTGIDTISYFAYPFRHDLDHGFPLLTTKKMSEKLWSSLVHELLWFISGENHIRNLRKHTKIWNAWADDQGNLETAYGFYWRNFPHLGGRMTYYSEDGNSPGYDSAAADENEPHIMDNFDQLGYCVEQLKKNPNSRRLVVSAWEPYNAHKSKLPPCHLLYIFNVQDGRLCLHLTQRSCDVFLGVPFNIASYALLVHVIAREVGLKPGILSIMFTDAHIYCADGDDQTIANGAPRCEYDHVGVMREQLERVPYELPNIEIFGGPWDRHSFDDFKLINYNSHGLLKGKVAV